MSAQSGSKYKEASARSKAARSISADAQLAAKTQRALESQNVQKPAGKLTPDVDEQPSDSNDGSADETAGQSSSRMKTSLPTFKGDAKEERYRHASPVTVEREYRAEEKRETRAMDTKGRIEFKPRAMRSDFQTRMRDEYPRKQFEDFASDAGSEEDRRQDKSFANRICSVKVAGEIGMPVPGNRYGLDATWVHISSVSEFPHNARNLTSEQYVQIGNLQAMARAGRFIEESLSDWQGNTGNDDLDETHAESIYNAQIVQDRAKAAIDSLATLWEYGEGADAIYRFQQNHDKSRSGRGVPGRFTQFSQDTELFIAKKMFAASAADLIAKPKTRGRGGGVSRGFADSRAARGSVTTPNPDGNRPARNRTARAIGRGAASSHPAAQGAAGIDAAPAPALP